MTMAQKILIIEDDEDQAKILKLRLNSGGFDARSVPDALLAIQEARTFKPELIFLDLMLPGGGGLEVLGRLKLSIYTNKIPIVVMTGMDNEEYKSKVLKIGVEAFVQKPYDTQKMVELARGILEGVSGSEKNSKPAA